MQAWKTKTMQEYYKINLRTSFSIILSMLIIGLTILVVWVYFQTFYSFYLVGGILLISFIIFAIYYALKSKIILTNQEIISKTPFKIKKLNYSDIKKLGVYAAANYVYELEKPKYHKWTFFEQKFIYLTTNPDLKPYFLKKPKDFIDFHYRRELYQIIEKRINAST